MYSIKYTAYSLDIDTDKARVGVIIDGCKAAELDMRSAVNKTGDNLEKTPDNEPQIPVLSEVREEENGVKVFVWKNKSSLWDEKEYTLTCTPMRFSYKVKIKGSGKVDGVDYFTGDNSQSLHGSDYEFQYGFFPCQSWYNSEDYYFRASTSCHRWSVLMVPPMFCYSFRCPELSRQLALGLVAEKGEHNFNSFDYNVAQSGWNSCFWLSTDQFGHVAVDGEWTAPYIIGFSAEDEFDAVKKYSKYYFLSGIAEPKKKSIPPKFWNGPIACGWIEQFSRDDYPMSAVDRAREQVYLEYIDRLHNAGLYPRCLIIDDKWQKQYCTDIADPDKWPDLRAFIDKQREENGIHTMLWFKIFDPEGLDDCATVTTKNGGKRVDPSHPVFLKMLDDAMYRLFSSDEGCYNCDGIKIDYAFQIPIGREFTTYSGKYGVELLYDLMEHIYTEAKKYKPEAVINCSPCHPYFAHICDQARLHDYNADNRYCKEDLEMRAKMYRIAIPDTLIDTDNAGYNTHRDTMRWLLDQPETGIPDIYCVSPLHTFSFTEGELEEIAQVWDEYTKRIDGMYD